MTRGDISDRRIWLDRIGAPGLNRRARLVLAALILVLCAVVLWQTAYWVRQLALSDIRDRNEHILRLVVANLRADLSKFQYQPSLLANSPVFRMALAHGASKSDLASVNKELERINFLSGALNAHLLNREGVAVAASNWAARDSFIGKDFSGYPYFHAALQGRLGRYFAVGGTPETEQLDYFFAYPVRQRDTVSGVVVIKLRIEQLAEKWLAPDHETVVVDEDGVIFMSSRSEWRFRTLQPLDPDARKQMSMSGKYGKRPLAPLRMTWDQSKTIVTIADNSGGRSSGPKGAAPSSYFVQQRDIDPAGWRVLILGRMDEVNRRQNVALVVASFMLVSLMLLAAVAHQRRMRLGESIALQARAHADLEHQVKARTKDLTEANVQLRKEIGERRRTEAMLRTAQDDLVQASKLAALGQMSAGLSHELNQPLAAIRSYSDNARTLLEREETASARTNLEFISELTDRMARIIRNLRTYARGEQVSTRPTSVNRALDEALGLLEGRLKSEGVTLRLDLPAGDLMVSGGAVRLQQVFVNIISNAIDAMSGTAEKVLEVSVEPGDSEVTVHVRDTGPGIPEDHLGDIFDPFFSTKEVGEGMGLGLSITYGIINQFGGSIDARNHPDRGAIFQFTLSRLHEHRDAAE